MTFQSSGAVAETAPELCQHSVYPYFVANCLIQPQFRGDLPVRYIITEKVYKEQQKNDRISKFYQKFEISKAVKSAGFYKRKGTQPVELLKYVFSLVLGTAISILRARTVPLKAKAKTPYPFVRKK